MRKLIWKILRKILFLFDAEKVHGLTVNLLIRSKGKGLPWVCAPFHTPGSRVSCWGMEFSSRVGLAAGFDKNAELLGLLPAMGFGFAEIGTVTPLPQQGNPKPRLFRLANRQAVFNRMGFNGEGAMEVARRLRNTRPHLPAGFRVGVNVGKNKDTPLELAHGDYGRAVAPFEGLADYLVINVSSPNTPGLRDLQSSRHLRQILDTVGEEIQSWSSRPPVLLKLAPEMGAKDLESLVADLESSQVDGWVIGNTQAGQWKIRGKMENGGWSGLPLRELARENLVLMRKLTPKPIISVGGIMSPEEARWRVEHGADFVQIYSGWIFNGPTFPGEITRHLLGVK